jgi:hypothetical protein
LIGRVTPRHPQKQFFVAVAIFLLSGFALDPPLPPWFTLIPRVLLIFPGGIGTVPGEQVSPEIVTIDFEDFTNGPLAVPHFGKSDNDISERLIKLSPYPAHNRQRLPHKYQELIAV